MLKLVKQKGNKLDLVFVLFIKNTQTKRQKNVAFHLTHYRQMKGCVRSDFWMKMHFQNARKWELH